MDTEYGDIFPVIYLTRHTLECCINTYNRDCT